MRADRLVAALLLMQARGRVTAAELAGELEVSIATARRDLEALSAAGIPVYPQPGRGGGWALVGGARTDLSGLTATEAQALFLLAGPAATTGPAVRSALRKLIRALPATFRADAQAAADAVVVDPARWGEHQRELPELVADLQTAVVRRRKVALGYANRAGERSAAAGRSVGPGRQGRHLVPDRRHRRGSAHLPGRPDHRRRHSPTCRRERPDDFELSRAWDAVVEHVEQARSPVTATVLIRDAFGAGAARPVRSAFRRRRHGRRRAGAGPGGGAVTALDRRASRRLGRHGAGGGAGIGAARAGPDRRRTRPIRYRPPLGHP